MHRSFFVVVSVVAAGCTCGGPTTPMDAGMTPMLDAGGGVQGDFVDRYLVNDGGLVLIAQRLSTRSIVAYVEAADGGFDALAGLGNDEGQFVIADVPAGVRYTLVMGSVRVNTDARALHLGDNTLGRPDVFQADRNEGLRLSLTNLAPWGADDEVQVSSWNAGMGFYSSAQHAPPFAENPPDAGDTTLSGAVLDFEGEAVPEVERGDDLTLLQLSGETRDGGVVVKHVTRALSAPTTLQLMMPTPVMGALEDVPQTQRTFVLRAHEFARHAGIVGLNAEPFVARLFVDAHPGSFGRTTHTGGTPDLATVEMPPDAGDATLALEYGNPFPPTWTPFVSAGALYDVRFSLPTSDGGMTFARSELGFVSVALPLDDALAHPVAPLVTPPRAVKLDGRDARTSLSDVSTTPEVSWQAPETGALSRVEIEAVELNPTMVGGTQRRAAGTVRVIGNQTRVRLPPGFLDPGASYFLRVTALSLPAEYDPTWPRLDVGPPAGAASTLTAVFTTRP